MSAAGAAELLRIAIRRKQFPAVGAAPPKLVIEDFSLDAPANRFMALFGPSGLILGPMLAAIFMTVMAIYRRAFADSLSVEQLPTAPPGE